MFKHIFTEPDNQTWCLVKVIMFIMAIAYIILNAVHVYHNHSFDPQAFGIGVGALLAGGGGSMFLKKDTHEIKKDTE